MIKFSQRGRPMHTRCPGPGLPPRARSEVMAAEARIDELYREAAARSR